MLEEPEGQTDVLTFNALVLVGPSSGGVADEAIVVVEPAEDGYGDDTSVLGKAMAALQERSRGLRGSGTLGPSEA